MRTPSNARQIGAITERRIANRGDRIGDSDARQLRTAKECPISNCDKRIRELDAYEGTIAIIKCMVSDSHRVLTKNCIFLFY